MMMMTTMMLKMKTMMTMTRIRMMMIKVMCDKLLDLIHGTGALLIGESHVHVH